MSVTENGKAGSMKEENKGWKKENKEETARFCARLGGLVSLCWFTWNPNCFSKSVFAYIS